MERPVQRAIQLAVMKINKVIRAVPTLEKYPEFFNKEVFKKTGKKKLIKDVCEEFEVSEKNIKMILNSGIKPVEDEDDEDDE